MNTVAGDYNITSGAVDDGFQFGLLFSGTGKFIQRRLKIVQECLPLLTVIFKWECDSAIDFPVYFCGPPVAQQTISVTKYLNPQAASGGALRPPEDGVQSRSPSLGR